MHLRESARSLFGHGLIDIMSEHPASKRPGLHSTLIIRTRPGQNPDANYPDRASERPPQKTSGYHPLCNPVARFNVTQDNSG